MPRRTGGATLQARFLCLVVALLIALSCGGGDSAAHDRAETNAKEVAVTSTPKSTAPATPSEVTATATTESTAPPRPEPKIYWAEVGGGQLRRANLNGSDVQDLVIGLGYPRGIALDAAASRIYWTDWGRYTDSGAEPTRIRSARIGGAGVEDLVTSPSGSSEITARDILQRTARYLADLREPSGVALDPATGKMYWTDLGTGKIQRANPDGSNVEDLVTGLRQPTGIALDAAAGKVYWTDQPLDVGQGRIQRANLDGSDPEDLVGGLRQPVGIALDAAAGKMYWADGDTGKIQRANLDGSAIEDIVTGLDSPSGIALDPPANKVYWTIWGADDNLDKIQRANTDGSEVEDVIVGLDGPSAIMLGPNIPVANVIHAPTPNRPPLGDWERFEGSDVDGDYVGYGLYANSHDGSSEAPLLIARCTVGGADTLFIATPYLLHGGGNQAIVRYRFAADPSPTREAWWSSDSLDSVVAPLSTDFVTRLVQGSGLLYVEFVSLYDSEAHQATFDVSGVRAVVEEMLAACR